jgi:hypothetical protein
VPWYGWAFIAASLVLVAVTGWLVWDGTWWALAALGGWVAWAAGFRVLLAWDEHRQGHGDE